MAVNVRRPGLDDARRIAEIHVRSWRAAYAGVLPDALLAGLAVTEREQMWRSILVECADHRLTLVAESPDGGLTGFCSTMMPSRGAETGEATAEIGALYVDPDHWREGAGAALLAMTLTELRKGGWREAVLWVLPENRPAIDFYERFGFAVEPEVEKREEESGHGVIRLRLELDEPIRLLPHDSAWARRFADERAALEQAIGIWATGGIHHVGSTAIPGLDAKPIIDILVGVESLEESRACFPPLASLGYLYAPYMSDSMHWFCKPHPSRRTHHLHLVPTGSSRFRDELNFRDRLRVDPKAAAEYAELKRELAARLGDDREAYTDGKASFIRRVLAGA